MLHTSEMKCCARRILGIVRPAALLLVGTFALSGCQQPEDIHLEFMPVNYKERHPVRVTSHEKRLMISLPSGDGGLTPGQKDRLHHYYVSYMKKGSGGIDVVIPSKSENEEDVKRTVRMIRQIASANGIAPGLLKIKPVGYGSSINFRYGYSVAKAGKCGEWPSNLGENYTNLHYDNFGCAYQRNLAAMVANPEDLVQSRRMGRRPSERRDVIWDKYVKGETTVSDKSSQEKGAVSEVAKE